MRLTVILVSLVCALVVTPTSAQTMYNGDDATSVIHLPNINAGTFGEYDTLVVLFPFVDKNGNGTYDADPSPLPGDSETYSPITFPTRYRQSYQEIYLSRSQVIFWSGIRPHGTLVRGVRPGIWTVTGMFWDRSRFGNQPVLECWVGVVNREVHENVPLDIYVPMTKTDDLSRCDNVQPGLP